MTAIVKFLPEEKSHEATRLLPYVMAVMVYLSALALMGSLMLHKGFGDWTESLSNRLTVQVTQADKTRRDAMVDDVTALLKQTPGIEAVRRLSDAEIDELLEPWLGVGNVAEDLPIPALLDVTVSRDIALNLDALRQQMQQISPDISLDDHQKWLGRFLRLMDTVEYTALGILILVILATICIVILAPRRVLAFITLVSLIYLSRDVASGLVKTPELPVMESAALLVIPLFAALISMLTARITVLRDLGRMI